MKDSDPIAPNMRRKVRKGPLDCRSQRRVVIPQQVRTRRDPGGIRPSI